MPTAQLPPREDVGRSAYWRNQWRAFWARLAALYDENGNIAPNLVITGSVLDAAITGDKIADATITVDNMAEDSVGADQIADGAVKTDKIADGEVTDAKLYNSSIIEHTSGGTCTTIKATGATTVLDGNYFSSGKPTILRATATDVKATETLNVQGGTLTLDGSTYKLPVAQTTAQEYRQIWTIAGTNVVGGDANLQSTSHTSTSYKRSHYFAFYKRVTDITIVLHCYLRTDGSTNTKAQAVIIVNCGYGAIQAETAEETSSSNTYNSATITLTGSYIAAEFVTVEIKLKQSGSGTGTVTLSAPGVDCKLS